MYHYSIKLPAILACITMLCITLGGFLLWAVTSSKVVFILAMFAPILEFTAAYIYIQFKVSHCIAAAIHIRDTTILLYLHIVHTMIAKQITQAIAYVLNDFHTACCFHAAL
jgi:tryptophan-rich sensory protein